MNLREYLSPKGAIASILLLSSSFLIGCGSGEKKPQPASEAAAQTSAAAENTIHITGNDQMQFSLNAFTVQAGQEVSVTLENVGNLPKQAMGHNLVIIQAGTDINDFAQKALTASENEYIPQGAEDVIIAHTKLLGPGESDTITFTAPSDVGEYPFLCTFPGHAAIMQGVMTVQ